MNLDPKDVKLLCKNSFWSDIFRAWCKICFKSKLEMWQPIWWNSLIRIGGKPIIFKTPLKNGLVEISQVYDGSKFISQEDAVNLYGVNVMEYNSIVSSITDAVKSYGFESREPLVYVLLEDQNITKTAHRKLLEKVPFTDNNAMKWSTDLGRDVSDERLSRLFCDIRSLTCVGKLQSFQYRLLRRCVFTNIHLKHWKKKDDDRCSFCGGEREDYKHLFLDCVYVSQLWSRIKDYTLKEYGPCNIVLEYEKVMFNEICSTKNFES